MKYNFLAILLFVSPLIIFLDIWCLTIIASLLREQSDVAVLVGTALISVASIANFLLIKLIIKKIKS